MVMGNTKVSIGALRSREIGNDIRSLIPALESIAERVEASDERQLVELERLHEILVQRRKALGIHTQIEAAALAGIGEVTYRKAERANGNPTLATLKAIAEGMNIKLWVEIC